MKQIFALLFLMMLSIPAMSATCKISEYAAIGTDATGKTIPIAVEPPAAIQEVTYTTSTQSAAFNSRTLFVRIVCDAKAHYTFGVNPTATATRPYLAADLPEYFAIKSNHKVAFYDGSS